VTAVLIPPVRDSGCDQWVGETDPPTCRKVGNLLSTSIQFTQIDRFVGPEIVLESQAFDSSAYRAEPIEQSATVVGAAQGFKRPELLHCSLEVIE
jgi:hypothetical protein